MPLRIDRVDTEIEILRKETDGGGMSDAAANSGGGDTGDLATARGRIEFREKLRPFVMEILNDELTRIKRKVGSP
ncbi:MAG TPA: hypothetical protein VHY35_24725 [Stellaceae bacterium]|jgi:hypothetical protein|nr:hypothetical protein [Stellaceae bacterium]